MNPTSPVLFRAIVALGLPAALSAQLPLHATRLDPTRPLVFLPKIVQTGDVVHAFAYSPISTPGLTVAATTYARSADGGRSWPVLEQSLGTFTFGDVASDGSVLAVAGWSQTATPWVAASSDGGLTWPVSQQISPTPLTSYLSTMELGVHVHGQTIVVVWVDLWGSRVFARRSTDGGVTWPGGDTQLSQSPWPLHIAVSKTQLQLVGDGATVHAFWIDISASSGHVQAQQTSTDGGASWLAAPRTFLVGSPGYPSTRLTVSGNANDLLLASLDGPLRRSVNGGVSWTPVSGLGIDLVTSVDLDGQLAVAVGTLASTTTWVVNVSTDGGQTWQGSPLTLPSIAGFDGRAHAEGTVVYASFPHGSWTVGTIIVSGDLGATWRVLQTGTRVFSPSSRRTIHGQTYPAGGGTWAFVGVGYSVLGTGTPGTGGLVPALRLDGLPLLGGMAALTIDQVPAGALGVLGLSAAPPAAIPFAGGVLWLQAPLATAVFLANGAGTGVVPLPVPNDPSLAGLGLTAQALTLDAAASSGFSLTNAIEVWVR